jgi:hypothetical protein
MALFIPDFRGAGSPGAPGVGSTLRGLQLVEQGKNKLAEQGLSMERQQAAQPGLIQAQKQKEFTGDEDSSIKSLVTGAQQLKLIHNPKEKVEFLKNRVTELESAGISSVHTRQALDQALAGDFEGLEAGTDELIQFGQERLQKPTQGKADGAFSGTGMSAQISNMLTKGTEDPGFRNTPAYARAYQLATEPKIVRTPTGDILMRPELPDVFQAPGGAAAIKAELPGAPKKSAVVAGTEKISVDQKSYNKDYILLKKSFDSMQNYVDVLTDLGPQMAVGPLNAADAQKINSAFSRAMLDAKETNNLGVLNGPDLEIMAKLMGDPTGVKGQIKGKEALLLGAGEAMKQITDNFSSLNDIMTDTQVKTKNLPEQKNSLKLRAEALRKELGL